MLKGDFRKSVEDALEKGFSDAQEKKVAKLLDNAVYGVKEEIEWFFKYELANSLSYWVVDMAERAIYAVLEGDQNQMERFLGCEQGCWTGRSDSPVVGREKDISEWHQVIHGELFEQGAVALRKRIVEAHPELLKNQRILDLEDQVKSLVSQVRKAEAERAEMWERLRPHVSQIS